MKTFWTIREDLDQRKQRKNGHPEVLGKTVTIPFKVKMYKQRGSGATQFTKIKAFAHKDHEGRGQMLVYWDPKTGQIDPDDDHPYGRKDWMSEFKKEIAKLRLPTKGFQFSELGLQGDNYVHLSMNQDFTLEFLKKFGGVSKTASYK